MLFSQQWLSVTRPSSRGKTSKEANEMFRWTGWSIGMRDGGMGRLRDILQVQTKDPQKIALRRISGGGHP